MALLGTWTALIPNKVIETRRFDGTTRRLIAPGWRIALGVVGAVLAKNVQLGVTVQNAFFSDPGNLEPVYFGGLFAIMRGWLSVDCPRSEGPIPLRSDLVDGHCFRPC